MMQTGGSVETMVSTYIYGLIDPMKPELRYIGKSNNPKKRLKAHLRATNHSHLTCWVKALLANGIEPELLIIEEVEQARWQDAERYWIAFFEAAGANLVNGSRGGLGGTKKGHRFSPDGRARIDAAITKACKGKPLSEQHRRKLSEAHKGKKASAETKRKMSEAQRKRYKDPAERKKTGDAVRGEKNGRFGVKLSDETKANMSASMRGKGLGNESAAEDYPSFRHRRTGRIIPAGFNLAALCRRYDLLPSCMGRVARGKRKSHRGWVLNEE